LSDTLWQGMWGALAAWLHRREAEDAPPAAPAKVDALAADARHRRDEAALFEYLDNLPAGVFSANADGRILYANRTLAGWLGIEVAGLTGRPFADFVVEAEALPVAETTGSSAGAWPCAAPTAPTSRRCSPRPGAKARTAACSTRAPWCSRT